MDKNIYAPKLTVVKSEAAKAAPAAPKAVKTVEAKKDEVIKK